MLSGHPLYPNLYCHVRSARQTPGVDDAGAAMSTSAVASACEGGTQRVLTALAVVVSRIDHMAAAARGSADSYEVTDQGFADAMNAMGEL